MSQMPRWVVSLEYILQTTAHAHKNENKQTNKQTNKQANKQASKQASNQTNNQASKQPTKQTNNTSKPISQHKQFDRAKVLGPLSDSLEGSQGALGEIRVLALRSRLPGKLSREMHRHTTKGGLVTQNVVRACELW